MPLPNSTIATRLTPPYIAPTGTGVAAHLAAVDPIVTNDVASGFTPGQNWINTVSDEVFVLADGATGAAVWLTTTSLAGIGPHLTDLSALSAVAVANELMVSTGAGIWAFESGNTLRTSIGLAIGIDVQAYDATYVVDADIGVNVAAFVHTHTGVYEPADATILKDADLGGSVQAWDAQLDQIAALAVTDGNIIIGNGTGWITETGATARTSMGLGTGDNVTFTNITGSGNLVMGTAVGSFSEAHRLYGGTAVIGYKPSFRHNDSNAGFTCEHYTASYGTLLGDMSLNVSAANSALVGAQTTGNAVFNIKANPLDGTSNAVILFNYGINTTGKSFVQIFENTTKQHDFADASNSTTICRAGGTLGIGAAATTPDTSMQMQIGGDTLINGTMFMDEQAAASADNASQGQFWVKNDIPNTPYFTDDAGADNKLQYSTPELEALGGLTSAANKLPYFTGAGTAALADFSGNARNLLDDVSYTAMRATLGVTIGTNVQAWDTNLDQIAALLVADSNIIVGNGTAWVAETGATARTSLGVAIGTDVMAYDATMLVDADIGINVQAYDAELAAIAGLISAANKLPYFTGAGTAALADFSGNARNLLDDVSYSAMRETLGVGASDSVTFTSLTLTTSMFMTEQAVALADTVGDGQFWVKTATPNVPMFTDDAGTDFQLGQGGDTLDGLAKTDGNFAVANGTAWVAESGATARTSMGLGTGNTVTFSKLVLSSATALQLGSSDKIYWGSTATSIYGNTLDIWIISDDDLLFDCDDTMLMSCNYAYFQDTAAASYARFDGPTKYVGMGIVTAAPVSPLHVKSTSGTIPTVTVENTDTAANNPDGICIDFTGVTAGSASAGENYMFFRDAGGAIGQIEGDGGGGINFTKTSDGRLKTNIRNTELQSPKVRAIQIRMYERISSGRTQMGVITQELELLYPEFVMKHDAKNDYFIVEYERKSLQPKDAAGVRPPDTWHSTRQKATVEDIAELEADNTTRNVTSRPLAESDREYFYDSLDYSNLVVPLIQSHQELFDKHDALEVRVEAQDTLIASLVARLELLEAQP